MLWALALLGLVPAAFTLGDKDSEDSSETTDDVERLGAGSFGAEVDGSDGGDSPLDYAFPGVSVPPTIDAVDAANGDVNALFPNDPALPDIAGPVGAPDDLIIAPNDPALPDAAGPIGDSDDEALVPNEEPENVVGDESGDIEVHVLSNGGETFVLPDDMQSGGTDAILVDGVDGPTFETDGTLNIVEGGAGSDAIAAGDDAALIYGRDGDDALYGGDGPAVLDGGTGNDQIVAGEDAGSTYVLTGGAGSDGFGLHVDSSAGTPAVIITDYVDGEDVIMIEVDKVTAARSDVDVTVAVTEDGQSGEVLVNGVTVALVQGAPNLLVSDVVVTIA